MVVFRIIRNLYFIFARSLIYPIAILKVHSFKFIVAAAALYVTILIFSGEDDGSELRKDKKQPTKTIQPVTRVENGNSVFADDLLSNMSKDELTHYSARFYWVMDHQPNNEPHVWNFYNINGSITPKAVFNNKLGDKCRRFSEVLKVKGTQQTISGIACEQQGGGWCKLRNNSTPACDLGRKGGIGTWLDDTKRGIGNLFR